MARMSEKHDPHDERESPAKAPRWKRALLALAVVFVLLGVALEVFASPATPSSSGTHRSTGSALLGEGTARVAEPGSAPAEREGLAAYAPFFLKGGFSFLIAYAIGTVVRMFVKAGLILLGVIALGLMALSWAGVLTVDWVDISGQWSDLVRLASGRVDDAVALVTGSLPSTAAALGGLFVGFRRG